MGLLHILLGIDAFTRHPKPGDCWHSSRQTSKLLKMSILGSFLQRWNDHPYKSRQVGVRGIARDQETQPIKSLSGDS